MIRTWPASGRSRPVIIDSDVVFPAPFGPTSPASDPAAISRSIPATATFAPNLLPSPRTTMAGPPMSASSAPGSAYGRGGAPAGITVTVGPSMTRITCSGSTPAAGQPEYQAVTK